MNNMNCVSTMPEIMPEITDEAIIEALSPSGLMRKRSSTVHFWKSLPSTSAT